MTKYIPDAGDVISLNAHNKHIVVLVISPCIYNEKTGLLLCCPVTDQIKGYPFETSIDDSRVVLSDQIKTVNWRQQKAVKEDTVSDIIFAEVIAKSSTLIGG
ncbi:toxin MazF [Salmonella enterica subsp. enterica serovar Meleagridis]|nr:toxin MazF [Salmonella enterica subsp. enterica serovar Cerro]EGD4263646.1 toxin MazF [Salmonella enterica subsp. enterica serovar Cerro]EGD4267997.1 toxin MazF [Salmonella enterica subsp. enterica serovar Cerro]EGD4276641.1 toxin MazF [Salmonella enterica subsp. enterica serovar Meleagridis]EGD4286644.1 toxin MazF [Salmonella enterica subsp. enterica serovar Meleagridis]